MTRKINRPLINGLEEMITLLAKMNEDIDANNSNHKDPVLINETKNLIIATIRDCSNCNHALKKKNITQKDVEIIRMSLMSIFGDMKTLSSKENLILSKIKLSRKNYVSSIYAEFANALVVAYCSSLTLCDRKDEECKSFSSFIGRIISEMGYGIM